MTAEATAPGTWIIWVNWETHRFSRKEAEGFEAVRFFTEESCRINLRLLKESGFREYEVTI